MKKSLFMWLAIGSFGFVGALTRYGIGRFFGRYSALFPFGTFFINITGSFFLGWFMTWAQPRLNIPDPIRLGIAVGFVGAYTTFSTYMFETDRMLATGAALRSMLYLAGSVVAGLLAVRLGIILGSRMS